MIQRKRVGRPIGYLLDVGIIENASACNIHACLHGGCAGSSGHIAVTADQTTTVLTGGATATLPLTSSYTVPTTGIYYFAFSVTTSIAGSMFAATSSIGSFTFTSNPILTFAVAGQTTPGTIGTTVTPASSSSQYWILGS